MQFGTLIIRMSIWAMARRLEVHGGFISKLARTIKIFTATRYLISKRASRLMRLTAVKRLWILGR